MGESFSRLKLRIPNIYQHIMRNRWFLVVLSIGICLRTWAVWKTVLINPDGALYIYQAKMLVGGNWHKLTSCGISFISIYPFLITGAHFLVNDWILSAQMVSAIFSTATLFPIYFLCRRFFDIRVAALSTLIAALNPVMCSRSGDVVRDPVYWFFLALGLFYAVSYRQERPFYRNLIFASVAFMIAAWARIEAIVPLIGTAALLPFIGRKHLLSRLFAFLSPILAVCAAVLICIIAFRVPMDRFLRLEGIIDRSTAVIDTYHQIRSGIDHLPRDRMPEIMQLFLPEAKNNIWLIALGTVINRTLGAFFYPFVPFFLIGLFSFKYNSRRDWRWYYLLCSVIAGYMMLYFHLLNVWILEYRFMMLVFITSIPMAAAGLFWALQRIESCFRISEKALCIIVASLLLISGLPKNLQHRDPDKIVFRQIAQKTADTQGNTGPALISSSKHTHRLLSLYANINNPDPPCPEIESNAQWAYYMDDMDKMVKNMLKKHVGFFLYEEKHWPNPSLLPENSSAGLHFELID
ncbi:MAG: glycosyltransferase family 39 protein, partial [Desulfobacterales bacterium]|nr:glycosyltransferase family 39 protein [Desulfobacterales bacterium]